MSSGGGAEASLRAVHVGRIAPLGPVPSAFFKQPVSGRVAAGPLGLAGDEQADKKVHGGHDKAVYAYPSEGYTAWIEDFPARARTLVPGGMGENLVTSGLSEDEIHIGDVLRIGSATLQVTQPRQPCFKLGLYHREPKMVRRMIETARCGWYLRVLEAGDLGAGDRIEVIERQEKGWTVRRFAALIAQKTLDTETLAEIVAMPGLAESWQMKALGLLAQMKGVHQPQ
ncbi:MOSC domain-containing protein [Sphingoaurantiacus capsulatus]|uniref:MOSC domain-containing protein n=1 Tax=Sphingoaurantiacus capsulatus TaxID=1771310 RepID=A0ABV7XD14_9SPHN